MQITFYGTRGSTPVSGQEYLYYGGNTTCIAFEAEGSLLVVDCGTGLQRLWKDKFSTMEYNNASFLISHLHWDHIQGFAFFNPFFQSEYTFSLYGEARYGNSIAEQIEQIMKSPVFPIEADAFQASMEYHTISCGDRLHIQGFTVDTIRLDHPNLCTGFRISHDGRSVCVISDSEKTSPDVLSFAQDADVLIYDAQYTQEEYEKKVGWGHSTWEEGCAFAKSCRAGRLILTHHDTYRTDKELDELQRKATNLFQNAVFAYDGLRIKL